MLKIIKWELYKLLIQKKTIVGMLVILGFSIMLAFAYNQLSNMEEFGEFTEFHPLTYAVIMVSSILDLILPIFCIIAISSMICSDYSDGIMKMLLIRPLSRGKIFFSKYIAASIYVLLFLTYTYLVGLLVGFIAFDTSSPLLVYMGEGLPLDISYANYIGKSFMFIGVSFLSFLSLIAIATMLSTFIDSAAAVNGFVIVFIIFSGILTQIPVKFVEYIYNSSFLLIGNILIWGDFVWSDINKTIYLLLGYTIVFTVLGYLRFKKKDMVL